MRDSLQPARFPALPEGAGGVLAATRVAYGRQGESWVLQEAIPGPNFKRPSATDEIWVPRGSDFGFQFQASNHYSQPTSVRRRVPQPSDPVEVIKAVCHDPLFGVGGSGRRPSCMFKWGMGAWGGQNAAV